MSEASTIDSIYPQQSTSKLRIATWHGLDRSTKKSGPEPSGHSELYHYWRWLIQVGGLLEAGGKSPTASIG